MSGNARPVVCAIDLTSSSDEVLRQADALARRIDAPLVVLHVLPNALRHHPLFPQLYPRENVELAAFESRACEVLSERVATLTGRGSGDFRAEVDTGTPYAAIVRRAEELNAEVVVVGGRRPDEASDSRIGDVAVKVVRHASGPVLVARPSPASGNVLAATDLSDASLPAVVAGVGQARRGGKRLTVLHVIDVRVTTLGYGLEAPPAVADLPPGAIDEMRRWADERLAEALRALHAEAEPRVERGNPADAIRRVAEELPAELLVIGTAGRTGLSRILLGSVAEEVVRSAPCSVLVARLRGS